MHKRKYTKEQLEFYFKELMNKLKRIPREEDMSNAKKYPSVKSYVDRFGSWESAVKLFANFDLAKKRCLNCGKSLIKRRKQQKFCSDKCAREYYIKKTTNYTRTIDKKVKALLDQKCFVCDFDKIIEVHCLDNKKESTHKILKSFNNKDLTQYVLLCPNHHQMIHTKMARLYYKEGHMIWEEIES